MTGKVVQKDAEINTYPNFMRVHRVVGVSAEQVHGQWVALAELGGEQQCRHRQQLQLLPRDRPLGQKPVHVAHCQRKHLLLTLLFLAHLI